MIVGIGVDVVDVPRFAATLRRTPALLERLFTAEERTTGVGSSRTDVSLAARFAAKEAVAKALGAPAGLAWHDCEVVTDDRGRPRIRATGSVEAQARAQGVVVWHLSLSHDGGTAVAYVVAEGS